MDKVCQKCGRRIEYRKKWKKNWDQILYCSEKCRRSKNQKSYESALLNLLQQRSRGATICLSEILTPEEKQNKEIMERVRESARLLVDQGKIEILQKGKVIDPSEFRGTIRLRLK